MKPIRGLRSAFRNPKALLMILVVSISLQPLALAHLGGVGIEPTPEGHWFSRRSQLQLGPSVGSEASAIDLRKAVIVHHLATSASEFDEAREVRDVVACSGLVHVKVRDRVLASGSVRTLVLTLKAEFPEVAVLLSKTDSIESGNVVRTVVLSLGDEVGLDQQARVFELFSHLRSQGESQGRNRYTLMRCERSETSGIITGSNRSGRD